MERLQEIAGSEVEGLRLDQALPRLFTDLSRRAARRLLNDGAVYVDGRRQRVASRAVRKGQRLEIVRAPASADKAISRKEGVGPLEILFEDDVLIAVEKPSGLPAQATVTDAVHNLEARLREMLRRRDGRPPYLALHHRLDRGTSGVMVLAKHRQANKGLATAFSERKVTKIYLARVDGKPPASSWEVENTLSAKPWEDGRVMREAGGRAASTEFQVREEISGGALIEARPKTGRLHQIRVHLADSGVPVIGDTLYGGPPASRLMLHAYRLEIPHPLTGKTLTLESPAPADFQGER